MFIGDGPEHWRRQGFVELVAPLRAPSNAAGDDLAAVWLRVPEGALIRAWRLPDGRPTVAVPEGTEADRVETVSGVVADVRGTRFGAGGRQLFHVLRPADSAGRLVGYEWERSDAAQAQAAAVAFDSLLDRTGVPAGAADRFRERLDCATCHPSDKPANDRPGERGLPNRRTDASGLYQLLAVLSDESPLEAYRPREMNAEDPFVTFSCRGVQSPAVTRVAAGAARINCPDGSVPIGRLDLRAALRARDPHAARVCEARLALEGHMDATGRAAFAAAFDECRAERP